jgi:hypothetical protein
MPAVIPFIPLIVGGIAGGTAVAKAHMESGAAENAANTQAKAATTAAGTQATAATKTAQIQADAANRAADLQAKAAADALQFSRAQSQTSLDQYNQQQQRLTPYRNLGNFALGQPMEGNPAPISLPNLPGQSSSGNSAMGVSVGGDDPANYTLSLVKSGISPQQAAQQTNQKFGLTTGSEAVYYPDSNTIGLPNAYLAGPTNKPDSPKEWGIVPRSGGGGQATGGVAARTGPVTLNYTPQFEPYAAPAPLTPALQAPQYQYAPLNAIGRQV